MNEKTLALFFKLSMGFGAFLVLLYVLCSPLLYQTENGGPGVWHVVIGSLKLFFFWFLATTSVVLINLVVDKVFPTT